MNYSGQDWRWVFDRRANSFDWVYMHLFNATFADGLTSEIQVNTNDYAGQSVAAVEADIYGRSVGRLPTSLRTDVDSITIHKGFQPFGGGNNNLLIHTDQAVTYGGYLEEVLFHEATHTSYDADHASSPGWLTAQQNDPTFISTYAMDNPTREDVAESLLPWFAMRHTDALFPFQIDAINSSIPNRLAYFDALPFQLNQPPTLSGDFNGDGVVSGNDLPYWETGYGMVSGASSEDGDADDDGDVDGSDFLIWQRAYAATAPHLVDPASVPEPVSFVLFGLGLAATATAKARSLRKHTK
jgi:hypothetical protein